MLDEINRLGYGFKLHGRGIELWRYGRPMEELFNGKHWRYIIKETDFNSLIESALLWVLDDLIT